MMVPRDTLVAPFANQIDDFKDGEEYAGQAGDHHKDGKDSFLSRPSNEAVHRVRTGRLCTLDERGEIIALIDVVEEVNKGGIHTYFEDQGEDIGPPQASTLLACVLIETATVLAMLELVFFFPILPVGHMHHH